MGRLDVGGDMMALINVFGPFDRLTVDGALTSPVGIFVTGQIDKLVAGLGMDTTLQAANVDKLQVEAGDLAGDLWFTNGGGSVRVDNGDFTADLLSGDAGLSKVEVKNGTFKGVIDTSGKIDKFSALATNGGSRAVILADLGIGKLSVKNDMVDTDVGVGVRGVAAGVEVELGKLDVGGAFRSSNVLAGVWNDPDAIEPFSAGCEDGTPYVAPDTLGTVYIGKVSIDGPIGVFGPSTEWAIASKDPMDDFEPEFAGNSQNFGNVNVTKDV